MYLIAHVKAAFAEMGVDEIAEKARAILRRLDHECLISFKKRDVHQGMRGLFKRITCQDLAKLLAKLENQPPT